MLRSLFQIIGRRRFSRKMENDWDRRAKENAFHFIADGRIEWTEGDFYKSGEMTVQAEILTDMENICQGSDPSQMKILEIGCGAGRVTRALAGLFGQVHAVDVSEEMLRIARRVLADIDNVQLYRNDGLDLSVLPDSDYDFAFSTAVFHHIGDRDVIENYIAEVGRRLKPGRLFKFEVQGDPAVPDNTEETWLGASFTARQMVEMAVRRGFDPRYREGEGRERFWWWFFKWPSPHATSRP
jgi:SAM-dependent methyltransferase